jgi:dihydroorotate dehydrogenase (NAD+) catalytic subunit
MDWKIELGRHSLSSPLIAASGTVGSVVDFTDTIDFSAYGAAVAKSVSPEAWEGRPAPRIAPVGTGMLNGIGIQNPGIDAWVNEIAPSLPGVPTEVWGSAVAHEPEGFGTVAQAMDHAGLPVVEVNLSCPNLDGIPFALDPALSARVISIVRSVTDLPIGAKLSSDAGSIVDVAEAVADVGADWVVVANTVVGTSFDVETRRPKLSGVSGGYSGDAIRPIALNSVLRIAARRPDLPIVGCGGVSQAEHVVEYLLAGASAVAIGSAHFATPRIANRIRRDLAKYCDRHNTTLSDLKGAYEPWT